MEREATGIINACSNLVTLLDAHPIGGILFVCVFAMLMVGVAVVCLARSGRP